MQRSIKRFVDQKQAQGHVFKELYLHIGQGCQIVFAENGTETRIMHSNDPVDREHLSNFDHLFKHLAPDARRAGIDDTLHRVSRIIHGITDRAVAIAARVGRVIQGEVLPMLVGDTAPSRAGLTADELKRDMAGRLARRIGAARGGGLLLVGPPNVGKTTVLRELARLLSMGNDRVVCVVDKSLEIGGSAEIPHAAIGSCRRLTMKSPTELHTKMVEAVENMSPEIVLVDEISNRLEAHAARTITGRGVAIVASVHGRSLAEIINDPERAVLCGGITGVTLSAREASARRDKRRQVSKRTCPPVFSVALEMRGFHDWILHPNLEATIDAYLDHTPSPAEWRRRVSVGSGATAGGGGGGGGGGPQQFRVESVPLAACHSAGNNNFAYAKLARGETLGVLEEASPDFADRAKWREIGDAVYERVSSTAAAAAAAVPPPSPAAARLMRDSS